MPPDAVALGPFHDRDKEWQEVRAQFDQELAKFPWFAPVAVEVFGANTLGVHWDCSRPDNAQILGYSPEERSDLR